MDGRDRLLSALDAILAEEGLAALTLRAVARRAGVSHALPARHFGDLAGMFTTYVAARFRELGASLAAAEAQATSGADALALCGRAYVEFGLLHPARFELMFRLEVLRADDPDFRAACVDGFAPLHRSIARCATEAKMPADEARLVAVAAWSMVHGFTTLWQGGHLGAKTHTRRPGELADALTALFAKRMTAPERSPA